MSAAAPVRVFVSDLAKQGKDSLGSALKIISDLTAQEVTLVFGMLRERASLQPAASAAERAITGFTGGGKILLDLAASETAVFVDALKEAVGMRPSVAALADMVPLGMETLIAMHKRLLDAVAKQTEEIVEAYTEGKPLMAGERLANMTSDAIESFIKTQKKFLDQVEEQVTIATQGGKQDKAAQRDRSKALIKLSREGIDKFIEAQKQVMELAIEKVDAEKGPAFSKPGPRTSLAELTQKSVHNFTSAQKSLLNLALKATPDTPEYHKAHAARPRAKARKRPAAAKA